MQSIDPIWRVRLTCHTNRNGVVREQPVVASVPSFWTLLCMQHNLDITRCGYYGAVCRNRVCRSASGLVQTSYRTRAPPVLFQSEVCILFEAC